MIKKESKTLIKVIAKLEGELNFSNDAEIESDLQYFKNELYLLQEQKAKNKILA